VTSTRRLFAALVAALALASSAAAHGPFGGGVGYVSTVSGLSPPVLGVVVTVLGGDDRLQLVNYSGKTVTIDGYQGEPFVRFTSTGVYENVRSPATYQSLVRDPSKAPMPPSADAKAPPVWRKVSEGSTFAWHDHRIHWTHRELPAVIKKAPRETHLIFRWRVPGHAGPKRFAVEGFLGYRPPPDATNGGTSIWWIAALVGGLAAAVGIGAEEARRRTRRRAS
jgi:hypothetical protein